MSPEMANLAAIAIVALLLLLGASTWWMLFYRHMFRNACFKYVSALDSWRQAELKLIAEITANQETVRNLLQILDEVDFHEARDSE